MSLRVLLSINKQIKTTAHRSLAKVTGCKFLDPGPRASLSKTSPRGGLSDGEVIYSAIPKRERERKTTTLTNKVGSQIINHLGTTQSEIRAQLGVEYVCLY